MHVEGGRIRRLHAECKALTSTTATSAAAGPPSQLDWEGAPPPKLSQGAMTGMEQACKANYPGEVLNQGNTPGPRYWAKVFAQLRPGAPRKFLDWVQTTSITDEERITERRHTRQPRSEVQALLNCCFEDAMDLNQNEITGNPFKVLQVLEKRRNAYALCGAAHVASIRLLDTKLLQLYTATVAPDLGLRPPTLQETMAADRTIWTSIFELVNKEGWGLEDALHELTTIRGDLKSRMQPRPKMAQSIPRGSSYQNPNQSGGNKRPLALMDKPSGKNKDKGKGKGKENGKGKGNTSSKTKPGGNLCDRYSQGACTLDDCKFVHRCNKVTGGRVCAERHPAIQCPHKGKLYGQHPGMATRPEPGPGIVTSAVPSSCSSTSNAACVSAVASATGDIGSGLGLPEHWTSSTSRGAHRGR